MRKYLQIIFIVAISMTIFVGMVLADGDGDDTVPERKIVSADCEQSEFGSADEFTIEFECSTDSIVYFGVCDSSNVHDDEMQIFYNGVVVASNYFSAPGQEVARVGNASVSAGSQTADLIVIKAPDDAPTWLYSLSTDKGKVDNDMKSQCGANVGDPEEGTEEPIIEPKVFENVNPGDDPLVVMDSLETAYTNVTFKAEWEGGSNEPNSLSSPDSPTEIEIFVDGEAQTGAPVSSDNSIGVVVPEPGTGDLEIVVRPGDEIPPGSRVTVGAYIFASGGVLKERGSIRGTVYEDANLNGEMDDGEVGIPNVNVRFEWPGDQLIIVTGDDGTFAPVALGKAYYTTEVIVPEGWVATSQERIEGFGIGIEASLYTGVNFGLTRGGTGGPLVPAALPASGFGPPDYSLVIWLAIGGLLLVGGALALRARRQSS